MIAPLRRRHRALTLTLALVLPVPVALSLSSRDEMPERDWPDHTQGSRGFDRTLIYDREEPRLAVYLGPGDAFGGSEDETVFRVQVLEPMTLPDLLFYGSPTEARDGEGVPESARLLGTLEAVAEPTPIDAAHLVVYSLGHARVIRSIPLD